MHRRTKPATQPIIAEVRIMAPKHNPLGLNPLQLKTLTLLQELAQLPDFSRLGEDQETVVLTRLPHPHGDHFHLGEAVVASRDATGLRNPSVWAALERKGLVHSTPPTVVLTAQGLAYATGLREKILHLTDHD
ncbi:MAG TPA: hypothetical protein VGI28_13755 [Stellaceae bacterium]|jgi:hypothetical protein